MKTTAYVEFKVFGEGHRSSVKERMYAPAGVRLTSAGVESLTDQFIASLQSKFPLLKFKAIRVSPSQVNIVHEAGNA